MSVWNKSFPPVESPRILRHDRIEKKIGAVLKCLVRVREKSSQVYCVQYLTSSDRPR